MKRGQLPTAAWKWKWWKRPEARPGNSNNKETTFSWRTPALFIFAFAVTSEVAVTGLFSGAFQKGLELKGEKRGVWSRATGLTEAVKKNIPKRKTCTKV